MTATENTEAATAQLATNVQEYRDAQDRLESARHNLYTQITAAYRLGLTQQSLAKQTGLSFQRIAQIVNEEAGR
jgi:hypothetical protein